MIKREYTNLGNLHGGGVLANSFSDYVAQTQQYLIQAYDKLNHYPHDRMLAANSPYELQPICNNSNHGKNGALLIHGLLDSPYSLRHMAQLLSAQGCLTRSILLPGHGTSPKDLLSISYHDWLKTVDDGITSLQQKVDNIYLVGFSAGATLSLQHANHHKVKGLILLAPAIKLKSTLARHAHILSKLSQLCPSLTWYSLKQEDDYAKYRSISFHLADQAHMLSTLNKPLLRHKRLNCPMLLAISEDDETVCTKQAKQLFHRHDHPTSRMLIYSKDSPQHQPDNRIIYRNSQYQQHKILDYSHVCIPIAPDDHHYGINGDYVAELHVPKAWRQQTEAPQDIYYGALSKYNLANYPIRRLTYNPDFVFLAEQIKQFIANT